MHIGSNLLPAQLMDSVTMSIREYRRVAQIFDLMVLHRDDEFPRHREITVDSQ